MFSNSSHVQALSLSGQLKGWKPSMNKDEKPCKTYYNKAGEKKFCGTKFLKRTESLGYSYCRLSNILASTSRWDWH